MVNIRPSADQHIIWANRGFLIDHRSTSKISWVLVMKAAALLGFAACIPSFD